VKTRFSFLLSLIMFISLFFLLFSMTAAAEDFILPIENCEQLSERYIPLYDSSDFLKIAENPEGEFLLMNDVALTENAMNALSAINFQGNFEGNGHTVTINKTVKAAKNGEYGGLFKAVTGGYVQNVRVTGTITLTPASRSVVCYTGGIAAILSGEGYIHNAVSDVDIIREDGWKFSDGGTGGIVGELDISQGAFIQYARNKGAIRNHDKTSGIVGLLSGKASRTYRNAIFACINDGDITDPDYENSQGTGGIAGTVKAQVSDILNTDEEANVYNRLHAAFESTVYGVIDNWHESGLYVTAIVSCVNNGSITGFRDVGGIVGYQDKKSFCLVIVNCLNIPDINCGYDGYPTCAAGILGAGHAYIGDCVTLGVGNGHPAGCAAHGDGRAPFVCVIEDTYFSVGHGKTGVLQGISPDGKKLSQTDTLIQEDRLNQKESYPGLDFNSEWVLENGMDYPFPKALHTPYKWIRYSETALESDIACLKGNSVREKAVEEIMNQYEFTLEEKKGILLLFAEGYGAHPGDEDSSYARSSALGVMWIDGKIVFAGDHCATYPDYPFDVSRNEGTPVPTVIEGKYGFFATNHLQSKTESFNYPALKINTPSVLRLTPSSYEPDTSTGINIHAKSTETLSRNSTGCTVLGNAQPRINGRTKISAGSEYTRFAYLCGFAADKNGDGYAEIETGIAHTSASGKVIISRAYGYENVPAFRENFNNDYMNKTEVIEIILGFK